MIARPMVGVRWESGDNGCGFSVRRDYLGRRGGHPGPRVFGFYGLVRAVVLCELIYIWRHLEFSGNGKIPLGRRNGFSDGAL